MPKKKPQYVKTENYRPYKPPTLKSLVDAAVRFTDGDYGVVDPRRRWWLKVEVVKGDGRYYHGTVRRGFVKSRKVYAQVKSTTERGVLLAAIKAMRDVPLPVKRRSR